MVQLVLPVSLKRPFRSSTDDFPRLGLSFLNPQLRKQLGALTPPSVLFPDEPDLGQLKLSQSQT
jgi:hypothetical protein